MPTSLVDALRPGMAPSEIPLIERRSIGLGPVNYGPVDLTSANMTGAGYGIGGYTSNIGRAYWIDALTVTTNKNVLINLQVGVVISAVTGAGTPPIHNAQQWIPANVPTVIPIKALSRGGTFQSMSASIKAITDTDKTGFLCTISVSGYAFTDDLDFSAPRKMLVLGDSLLDGTGPTVRDNFMPWKIRRYYSDKGIRLRMINGSISGSTSQAHELFRQGGIYDHDQIGLIVYQLGTNNAVQAIAASQSTSDLNAMMAWKKIRHPDAQMIVLGPPPAENATTESNLVGIRSALSAAVTAAADPKVNFKSLAGAFDSTLGTTVYVSTDPAGSRLHPNDTGIGYEWNGGYNGFVGIKAWLDTNLPTV